MFDERTWIARMESADAYALAEMLEQPTQEEERALRVHFGDARYQRLHRMALRRGRSGRGRGQPRVNVVVIHDFLGSDLLAFDRAGESEHVWLNVLSIASGHLDRLRLADNGLADYTPGDEVRPTSIIKRYYGELLLALTES